MDAKMNKKGQMIVWVIVAMIIVAAIMLIFMLRPQISSIVEGQVNIKPIIDSCVRDEVNKAVKILLPRGGFIDPKNTKTFDDVNVTYLCENIGYFSPCINQHPLLIREIENEINEYINPGIESCFDSMKEDLEQKQNKVNMGPLSMSVELKEGYVKVFLDRNVTVTKGEQTQNYNNFDSRVNSPVYELARIAQEIVNQEATNCYFEYVGYMMVYPKYSIELNTQSDLTKIYSITDDYTNKKMNIAIRGCALPAGGL